MGRSVKSIMLQLINITKTNNTIEADYIPENSNLKAHALIDLITGESSADVIEEYGSMYSRMAINGLKCTLDELKKGTIEKVPEKRTVMWY